MCRNYFSVPMLALQKSLVLNYFQLSLKRHLQLNFNFSFTLGGAELYLNSLRQQADTFMPIKQIKYKQ